MVGPVKLEHIYFGIVVFCFFIALINTKPAMGKKDYFLLIAALFFTVISDLFIIELDKYELGVTTFCVAQLIYFVRHTKKPKYLIYCPLILIPAALVCLFWTQSYLIFISVVYAQCLLLSVVSAIIAFVKKRFLFPNNYFVLVGMVLFLLCDINVALFNLSITDGSIIWFFYAPSQVLLAISARRFER